MVLAAEFSAQLGMISEADAARVERHLAAVGLPTHLQDIAGFAQEGLADADALMELMAQDKKVKRGRLTFILLRGDRPGVRRKRRRAGAGSRLPATEAVGMRTRLSRTQLGETSRRASAVARQA